MATPSYSARFSSATSRASPASSFVSTKLVAWNPSERSFSWMAAAISGCLPNPRMRQPIGREEDTFDILELNMLMPSLVITVSPIWLVREPNLLQFYKYHLSIRISYVFTYMCVRFHPTNTSRFDVNLLPPTIRKCQTPLERRLSVQHVVRVSVL